MMNWNYPLAVVCFALLLCCSVQTVVAQAPFWELKPGIEKIEEYELKTDAVLSPNHKASRVDSFDRQGRILRSRYSSMDLAYTYSDSGSVTMKAFQTQFNEESEGFHASIYRTDTSVVVLNWKHWYLMMSEPAYDQGGENFTERFAHIPERRYCKDCPYKEKIVYKLDENGRIAQKIRFYVAKSGSSRYEERRDIFLYSWIKEDQYLIRGFKPNFRDVIILKSLTVRDKEGAELFYKWRYEDPIDHLDNEALTQLVSPTYTYNKQGDWVERVLPDGKGKVVRKITYYK